ncbi:MAG TPA: hypothetical protein VK272_08385 [Solirubrobacteraceae bacterium]|nr:hypothetical protein [Solirubrobacteraceae bacterium]
MTGAYESKLDDVYGIAREGVPRTYIPRADVDERFVNEITRDQHIVVYGSSKQGKSSLLRTVLSDDDYVAIQCAIDWDKVAVYRAILKEIGISVAETHTQDRTGTREFKAEVKAEGGVPIFAKASGNGAVGNSRSKSHTTASRFVEFDPGSATDVIRVLQEAGFDRWIVLEDFHYLDPEVQRKLASDLKTFFERSKISFIIVGVWLEANRLVVYNGDLAGRITSIPADTWTEDGLRAVILAGEPLLNVKFSEIVIEELIRESQQNVGLLQEACRQMCIARNVFSTAPETVYFEDLAEAETAYSYVAEQLAARYANVISQFSEGLRDQELHMYKWIMHSVISAKHWQRKAGLKAQDIFRHIDLHHPTRRRRLAANNVTAALKNVAKIQHHAKTQPIVFDYDEAYARLRVVDNQFLLYLASTDKHVALSHLPTFPNEPEAVDTGEPGE